MLKRLVLLLLMLSPFMFSNAWADKIEEPAIVTINMYLRVYCHVAEQIAEKGSLGKNISNLEIPKDNSLLKKVINFYEIAKEQVKSYDKASGDKPIQIGDKKVSFTTGGRMVWVEDDEIAIKFDKEKKLVASLHKRE
ncbi:MAG: hypothetical protein LBB44_05330 [Endomicrobium sp.]|jgi:hypothetical protein|nr:hypothetical protein [Endomicrobium sp.]